VARIELRDLRFTTIIGLLDFERVTPQRVSLDLDLETDIYDAAVSDDVTHTTNYAEVVTAAQLVVTEGEFNLLETAAVAVANELLMLFARLDAVTVTVRKLDPPVDEDLGTVAVTVRQERN
jgi:dihydroneopterin aldolase